MDDKEKFAQIEYELNIILRAIGVCIMNDKEKFAQIECELNIIFRAIESIVKEVDSLRNVVYGKTEEEINKGWRKTYYKTGDQ